MSDPAPEPDPPSPFLLAHAAALHEAAALGPILDVACGRGRHALWLARRGLRVVGVDRNAAFLAALAGRARAESLPLALARCDLEAPVGPPLAPARCGAVLVFRYLHRPLCARLAAALRPGGLLLAETFTIHQRDRAAGPRNPDFLLEPGELSRLFPELVVVAHEEGELPCALGGGLRALARLAAMRPRPAGGA